MYASYSPQSRTIVLQIHQIFSPIKNTSFSFEFSLLKAVSSYGVSALAPFFVNLIKMLYTCCTVPARLKHAVVTPLLKRSGLATDNYSNYRPISNVPFASKLLERHVSTQLRLHLHHNNIEDPFQAPTGLRTASKQRSSVYRMMCCDR